MTIEAKVRKLFKFVGVKQLIRKEIVLNGKVQDILKNIDMDSLVGDASAKRNVFNWSRNSYNFKPFVKEQIQYFRTTSGSYFDGKYKQLLSKNGILTHKLYLNNDSYFNRVSTSLFTGWCPIYYEFTWQTNYKPRIIIADNSIKIRNVTRRIIEKYNGRAEIDEVGNEEDLIEKVREGDYGLVITGLPRLVVIEKIRAFDKKIPICMFTNSHEDAFHAGVTDYLQKLPLFNRKLREVLSKYI